MSKFRFLIIFSLLACLFTTAQAEEIVYPSMSPYAIVYTADEPDGIQVTSGDASGQFGAPAKVELYAEPNDTLDRHCTYRWKFELQGKNSFYRDVPAPGEWTEELTQTGTYRIVLCYTFRDENNTVQEVIDDENALIVTVKTSKLEFPNAFSPNGDGINDYYGAKSSDTSCSCRGERVCVHRGQSIVSFHAVIFNRWGQKLYSWDDVTGSWDGKFNGSDVKDGVYYVHAEAIGADGIKYDIKKDVNLLRGFTQKDGTVGTP